MRCAEACVSVDGSGGVDVDLASALALAVAQGADGGATAPLLVAAKQGILAGVAKVRKLRGS